MKRNKTISFDALRIFSVVTDSETLTHAAQRLGITQSAVSQAVKQLEDITQTNLIIRRSRPIKVTSSGKVLQEYSNSIMSDTGRMMNDVKMASDGFLSHLNVGMIDSFGDAVGLEFISQIKTFASKISLQTGKNLSLSESLSNRDIDILITASPNDIAPNLVRHPIIRDPFLVIAPSQSYPDSEINLKTLCASLPFIHYSPNSQIGAQTDLIARRLGLNLNTHYELDSTQTLVRFVKANRGWAIISAMCLVSYQNLLDGIKVINLNDGSNARYISQLSRKNELGDLPEKFADVSRDLFSSIISPKLDNIAPWLTSQAYPITKFPN